MMQKQMRMKLKYQRKDIYLQHKDNTLLMNLDLHENVIMEYQNIINFQRIHQINHPHVGQKIGLKQMINQEGYIMPYNTFKTLMLKSSLFDYIDAYVLVKERITITGDAGPEPNPDAPRTSAELLAARHVV